VTASTGPGMRKPDTRSSAMASTAPASTEFAPPGTRKSPAPAAQRLQRQIARQHSYQRHVPDVGPSASYTAVLKHQACMARMAVM
jgi:hypothetical protein